MGTKIEIPTKFVGEDFSRVSWLTRLLGFRNGTGRNGSAHSHVSRKIGNVLLNTSKTMPEKKYLTDNKFEI
jgi:hypothetical protein